MEHIKCYDWPGLFFPHAETPVLSGHLGAGVHEAPAHPAPALLSSATPRSSQPQSASGPRARGVITELMDQVSIVIWPQTRELGKLRGYLGKWGAAVFCTPLWKPANRFVNRSANIASSSCPRDPFRGCCLAPEPTDPCRMAFEPTARPPYPSPSPRSIYRMTKRATSA